MEARTYFERKMHERKMHPDSGAFVDNFVYNYGTPRLIAPLNNSLACTKPIGLSFSTEGDLGEGYTVSADGVGIYGLDDNPAIDPLPFVYVREADVTGFDHTQPWYAAFEIVMGWDYTRQFNTDNPAKLQNTCDWFNMVVPNAGRTGAENNEAYIFDRSTNQHWHFSSLNSRGFVDAILTPQYAVGDKCRVIISWRANNGTNNSGLHVDAKWTTDNLLRQYKDEFTAGVFNATPMTNPYITLSGAIAWANLADPWRSYGDGCLHRNFVLGNGLLDNSAIGQYLHDPDAFIAAVSAL